MKEIQSKTLTLKEKIDTLLSQKQFTSDTITQVIDCLSKQDKYLVLLVDEYNVACQSIYGDYNQEQINHFLLNFKFDKFNFDSCMHYKFHISYNFFDRRWIKSTL